MTVRITVAEITPPGPGKKQGYLTDTGGQRWYVWADKLHLYVVDGTYEITNTKTTTFRGTEYVTISEMTAVSAPAQAPAPRSRATSSKPFPPPPFPGEDIRRMDIFVCGAINNMLGNQNVEPFAISAEALVAQIERLKEIWRRTLGPHASQTSSKPNQPTQQRGDMDDEIPF